MLLTACCLQSSSTSHYSHDYHHMLASAILAAYIHCVDFHKATESPRWRFALFSQSSSDGFQPILRAVNAPHVISKAFASKTFIYGDGNRPPPSSSLHSYLWFPQLLRDFGWFSLLRRPSISASFHFSHMHAHFASRGRRRQQCACRSNFTFEAMPIDFYFATLFPWRLYFYGVWFWCWLHYRVKFYFFWSSIITRAYVHSLPTARWLFLDAVGRQSKRFSTASRFLRCAIIFSI